MSKNNTKENILIKLNKMDNRIKELEDKIKQLEIIIGLERRDPSLFNFWPACMP